MCFASRGDFYLWSVAGAVGSEQRDLLAKEIIEVTPFFSQSCSSGSPEAPPGSCWSHRGELGGLGLLAAVEMLTSIPPVCGSSFVWDRSTGTKGLEIKLFGSVGFRWSCWLNLS